MLDGLWTSRVTSHIALREVAEQITVEGVTRGIELIAGAMAGAGITQPRIAVCGLNPHNGDNGSFGREELDVIGPAVEAARARGIPVQGPVRGRHHLPQGAGRAARSTTAWSRCTTTRARSR